MSLWKTWLQNLQANSHQKSVQNVTDFIFESLIHFFFLANENEENPQTSKGSKTHCLLVSPKQRGNPLLKSICNVPWEYDDIVPDYQMGKTSCALFLSLRYHNLNPDYIHQRLKLLGKTYELRVLLVQVLNLPQ
jgi:hypothetical protein